ncbi:sulfide:quinone oxidoreductase [Oceanisphaera litoralis]|uniref:TIGR01244 family sulfur transferase n=1 Tax=Oceanisphaera litoralis TaxID=225144 RepID=UPI00195F0A30|nr:TIGR01244 family sulfur transferase [Oceanisphaera litoralis]MBM7455415.1 sulfide:quinone oxidoreductase [Oceanisphaera litoralis]
MDIKPVTSSFSVADQVTAADLLPLKAAGYRTLICNRPDGEAEGQPAAEALAAEARAQGFDWYWIPISSGQFTDEAVATFTQALAGKEEPVLAFCRTGTRSITLWALAQARGGQQSTVELLQLAAGAGYDLSSLSPRLDADAGSIDKPE